MKRKKDDTAPESSPAKKAKVEHTQKDTSNPLSLLSQSAWNYVSDIVSNLSSFISSENSQNAKKRKTPDSDINNNVEVVVEQNNDTGSSPALDLLASLVIRFPDVKTPLLRELSPVDLVNLACASQWTKKWTRGNREISHTLVVTVRGNEDETRRLIRLNPNLLLNKNGTAVDYSGRFIRDVTPFQAALRAGDVEMAKMMIEEGFKKLPDGGQAEIDKQFKEIFPEGLDALEDKQKENAFDFSQIAKAIIDAPADEVDAALNKEYNEESALHQALEQFRAQFDELSHQEKVFNPQHLLKAFEFYENHFDDFKTWEQHTLFCRQVIGFVQRYLPACYAQAFAQGLYYLVKNNERLLRSFDFRDGDGSIFPLVPTAGLGHDCWAGWDLLPGLQFVPPLAVGRPPFWPIFQNLYLAKKSVLEKLPALSRGTAPGLSV